MEIIKPGVIPQKRYFGRCPNCGCEFKIDASERKWLGDYDGGSGYYPCPTCGQQVSQLRKILPDGRILP